MHTAETIKPGWIAEIVLTLFNNLMHQLGQTILGVTIIEKHQVPGKQQKSRIMKTLSILDLVVNTFK